MTGERSKTASDIASLNRIPAIASLLEVVCKSTGMGFAAIGQVTQEKWVAYSVRDDINFGLKPGDELPLETTLCRESHRQRQEIVIDHVAKDPVWSAHQTPALYGFQSYISVPIFMPDDRIFGTLCAIDPKPAQVNKSETIGMFRLFADLISYHLSSIEQLDRYAKILLDERKEAEIREQFIVVLGHDLRNPLGAISNGAKLLAQTPLNDRALGITRMIEDSCNRMGGLIENILDFARGRMGGGIPVDLRPAAPLEKTLGGVIAELQSVWPGRKIETEFTLPAPVSCDERRIAQLFSNLLGNALTYGTPDVPVKITARSDRQDFILSVANAGKKIPEDAMARLFHPFSRGEVEQSKEGLGLGLYIAAEIARAHRGRLDVSSNDNETCFTLTIPASQTR